MAISKYDYYKRCCPVCRSFNVVSVAMLRESRRTVINNFRETEQHAPVILGSGFYCENCKRYYPTHLTKCIFDRKQMRRDRNKLTKFLANKAKD